MIDLASRKLLAEKNRQNMAQKNIFGGMFSAVEDAIKLKEENAKIMEKMDIGNKNVTNAFEKLGQAVVMIFKKIPSTINLPKIFNIQGKVEVTNIPETKNLEANLQSILKQIQFLRPKPFPTNFVVDNLFELKEYFDSLGKKIGALSVAISSIPTPKSVTPKIEIPKFPEIKIPKVDNSKIEELLQELSDKINNIGAKEIKFPRVIDVGNFPPTMTPNPVTSISINPLRGTVKTTTTTVGTSLTTLPSYGQLANRRAMLIYNNSNNTIFIGGSDVTASTGLPIPANSYSPILDMGYDTVVYGIASTSSNNVRVMEVSDEAFPGHPGL